jgi:hypothetical protein
MAFEELIAKKYASRQKLESEVEDAELALARADKKLRDKKAGLEARTNELEALEKLSEEYEKKSARVTELLAISQERIQNNEWDEKSMSWLPAELAAEKERLYKFIDNAPAQARKIYYNR